MDRSRGIAFCGLACALCGQNTSCVGCRDDGCTDRGWCKNLRCCRERGLAGCWECGEFPCPGGMLDKLRVRTFAAFVKQHGAEALLDCLERNERAGIQYHYPGKLVGDYDAPETEEGITDMLLYGRKTNRA